MNTLSSTNSLELSPPRPPVATSEVQPSYSTEIRRLKVAAEHLNLPEATLRDIRFYAEDRHAADGTILPGNGFAPAFLTLGRSVYVDIPVFVEIWRSQQLKGASRG